MFGMNKRTFLCQTGRDMGRVGQWIKVPGRLELNQMCVGGGRGFPSSLDRMTLVLQQLACAVRLQGGLQLTAGCRILQKSRSGVLPSPRSLVLHAACHPSSLHPECRAEPHF